VAEMETIPVDLTDCRTCRGQGRLQKIFQGGATKKKTEN